MLLTLDIGNTNITFGVYDGSNLLFVSRMATDQTRMEDQFAVEFREILNLYGVSADGIDGCAMSSVVPAMNRTVLNAVKRLTGVDALCVGPKTKTGILLDQKTSEVIGADLLVGCVAAANLFDGPCIVLDMGTATKFMVLDEERRLVGGAIAPGVGISLDALSSRTAQLPFISLEAPQHVIGRDTLECMRSGIINGTAYMIDGMCDHIEEELGQKCRVVATGGLCREIVRQCGRDILFCDTLLLDGLRILYENNR